MRVVVYGGGASGVKYCYECESDTEIVAIADGDENKQSETLFGHKIIAPKDIYNYDFDFVVICVNDMIETGIIAQYEMLENLRCQNIPDSKIMCSNPQLSLSDKRVDFIYKVSQLIPQGGAVAECGVRRGNSAYYINRFFPDAKFYLSDTFCGFDDRDVNAEPETRA